MTATFFRKEYVARAQWREAGPRKLLIRTCIIQQNIKDLIGTVLLQFGTFWHDLATIKLAPKSRTKLQKRTHKNSILCLLKIIVNIFDWYCLFVNCNLFFGTWLSNKQEWLSNKQAWLSNKQKWLSNKQEWLNIKQEWLSIKQKWHSNKQNDSTLSRNDSAISRNDLTISRNDSAISRHQQNKEPSLRSGHKNAYHDFRTKSREQTQCCH